MLESTNHFSTNLTIKYHKEFHPISMHVCKIAYSELADKLDAYLHLDEIDYLKTLKYEPRIKSYLLGRYAAKKAIASLLDDNDLTKIHVKNGVFNQPVILHDSPKRIQVSLTHCNDIAAAIAFPEIMILGIDIEKINSSLTRTVEAELTSSEKIIATRLSCSYESFSTIIWTLKESLSKAIKTGLAVPLQLLEVKDIEDKDGCWVSSFTNFSQYSAISFVVEGYAYSLTYPKYVEIEMNINLIKQGIGKIMLII
ncbi:4'-phosphopantetheinyl transferase family protein [Paenibacillus pini]|uniref:Phosphopantetheinyl transferase n=1 Tax=Paenibacillus pini JCM 16418 TaxID=1236976 RepID=W7YFP5_9BACL|nr:4'-phosphopantetheinyl transferase superfamily protein [Paenibacillus pini]GAF07297.1 phosphopantetheinyl transferase [Paenibacillus pini JCM 16418]